MYVMHLVHIPLITFPAPPSSQVVPILINVLLENLGFV